MVAYEAAHLIPFRDDDHTVTDRAAAQTRSDAKLLRDLSAAQRAVTDWDDVLGQQEERQRK